MKRQRLLATCLLVGFVLIALPTTVFAQEVVIEIAGNKASVKIPSISKGTVAIIPIGKDGGFLIRSLEIGAARQIEQADVAIELLDEKPMELAEVNGTVYRYLSITTNLEVDDVLYAKLIFGIPKSWMENENIEKTTVGVLGDMDGKWSIVSSTHEVEETGDEVIFSAELPNFSFIRYAVSGGLPSVTTTTTQITTKVTTITTSLATVTTTSTPVVTATVTTVVQGENTTAYLAIAVAIVAIAVLLAVFRSSRRT